MREGTTDTKEEEDSNKEGKRVKKYGTFVLN
jgi:hypothetical protein